METLPFLLVLISVFTHAYWNYLVKSSENKHIFIGLSKLIEVVIFAIPAIYFLSITDFKFYFICLVTVAASITFLNYYFLSNAYKHGELSLVYPVSRSSVLFLPFLAFIFIGEKVNMTGIIAVALILIGTFIMHLKSFKKKAFRRIFNCSNNKGTLFALLAALSVACYTLWDKTSIKRIEPFIYFYLYTLMVACFYNLYIFLKCSKKDIQKEWIKKRFKIIQVGFFNSFTYILILIALTSSKATYVGGLRQLSIAVGVFFGYIFLNENLALPKIMGVLISIIGGGLIYFSN